MTYAPHPAFRSLYDAYTGPGSTAQHLTKHMVRLTESDPLLLVTGADFVIFPVGVTGTEKLVPVGEERLHRMTARVTVGKPALSGDLESACDGNRRLMMDVVGAAIARLLPPEYRGVYGQNETEMAEAWRIAETVFGD